MPPFTSGGVGYFAYDMVRQFERLPSNAPRTTRLPDCVFTFYDRLLAFDHLRHQVHIIAAADVQCESPRKAYDRALADIAALERKLVRGMRRQTLDWSHRWKEAEDQGPRQHLARQVHRRACARAKEYIAAGDIFQVVLSQRLDFKAARRAVPDLSRAAHRQSVALHVLPEAR